MLLARSLGRTVDELFASMSAQEFSLWQAEYQRAPWGEVRGDINAGEICASVFNTSGRALPNDEVVNWADFMPFHPKQRATEPTVSPAEHFRGLSDGST